MKRTILRAARPGFSLLELMLVLAIIATLSTLVVVNVRARNEAAKRTATIASMTTIKTQIEAYNLANNAYPTTLSSLMPSYIPAGQSLNDKWETPFHYAVPGMNENPYQFISFGPDKQPGTADDIDVWTMNKAPVPQ